MIDADARIDALLARVEALETGQKVQEDFLLDQIGKIRMVVMPEDKVPIADPLSERDAAMARIFNHPTSALSVPKPRPDQAPQTLAEIQNGKKPGKAAPDGVTQLGAALFGKRRPWENLGSRPGFELGTAGRD